MSKKVCPNAERCDHDVPKSMTVDTFFWKVKDLSAISFTFGPIIQKSKNPKIQKSNNPKIKKSKNPKSPKRHFQKPKIQKSKNPNFGEPSYSNTPCHSPGPPDWIGFCGFLVFSFFNVGAPVCGCPINRVLYIGTGTLYRGPIYGAPYI